MVALLKLVRWPNLLMIAFIQYLIRFSFTEPMSLPHALDHWYFSLGVLCSILLAAGGYVINDLYDLQTDGLNKPHRITIGKSISEDFAWYFYFASVALATLCSYFLALKVDMSNLWMIAPLAASLLYLYAFDLKKRPIIGNVIVSLLTAMPIFLIAIFDFLPAGNEENAPIVQEGFKVIMYYSLLAFWLNFIREMIKDLEDKEGDRLSNYKTLAILLPAKIMKLVIIAIVLIGLYPILDYTINSLFGSANYSSGSYVLMAVVLPLIVLIYQVFRANSPKQFHEASNLAKLIMLLGILSMPFFTLAFFYGWP